MSWDVYRLQRDPRFADGKEPIWARWMFLVSRAVARSTDFFLCWILVGHLDSWLIGQPRHNLKLSIIAAVCLTGLMTAACTWLFGATPGKWIAKLRVETLSGEPLSMKQAFLREWYFLRHGLWFMILFPIPLLLSCVAILSGVRAKWDRRVNTRLRDTLAGDPLHEEELYNVYLGDPYGLKLGWRIRVLNAVRTVMLAIVFAALPWIGWASNTGDPWLAYDLCKMALQSAGTIIGGIGEAVFANF